MLAAASGNTVAIYALIVAALVGFGSPWIQSHFAGRRQKESLDAAKVELTTQLKAESDRLDQTLAADHRRTQYEAEREILDAGAVFLQRFRAHMGQSAPAPGSADWHKLAAELGGYLARLRLWFEEESDIVKAFQEMLTWCGTYGVELGKSVQEKDAARMTLIENEIAKARNRYLDAAHEHLKSL
jgi:hypothetical protein